MTIRDRLKGMREHPSDPNKPIRQSYGKRLTGISETQRNPESIYHDDYPRKEHAMNPFLMPVEYIDAETGELVTDTILVDDWEAQFAELFQPEPDNNSECPW